MSGISFGNVIEGCDTDVEADIKLVELKLKEENT